MQKNETTLKEIQQAKELLKNNGYYINDLWHILDVKDSPHSEDPYFNCSDSQAYEILNNVFKCKHLQELIENKIRFEVYQYS